MYERNWPEINKNIFLLQSFEKDWDGILHLSRKNIDLSFNNFMANINNLLISMQPQEN